MIKVGRNAPLLRLTVNQTTFRYYCVLLLVLIPLLASATLSDQELINHLTNNGKVISFQFGTIYYEKGDLTDQQIKDVTAQFKQAALEIPRLLNRSLGKARYGDHPLTMFISHQINIPHAYFSYDSNHADRPYFFIPTRTVKMGLAPILHEATHIIADRYWSLSLREGLADFVQFFLRPGKAATMNRSISDFHQYARELIHKNSRMIKYIGSAGYHFSSYKEREDFYQLSRSFVAFLINKYGGARFLTLYQTKDGYQQIYGDNLSQLRARWKKSVATPLTKDDFPPNPFYRPWYYHYYQKILHLLSTWSPRKKTAENMGH